MRKATLIAGAVLTQHSLCLLLYLPRPKEMIRSTHKKEEGKLSMQSGPTRAREKPCIRQPGHNTASFLFHLPVLFVDLIPKAHCAHNSQLEIDVALLQVIGIGFQLDPRL